MQSRSLKLLVSEGFAPHPFKAGLNLSDYWWGWFRAVNRTFRQHSSLPVCLRVSLPIL